MRLSERIYRILLKGYHRRYRERYEEPMAQLFSDQLQAATGARPLVRLWLRTLIDLFLTVPARYFDHLRGRGRFSSYSESAMRSCFFARYTAAGLGHAEITAEDILAGLLRENREIRSLFRRDALDEIHQAVGLASKPAQRAAPLQMPLSDTVKEILSLANLEAERTGAKKIMPRHLAAGILRQGQTLAADLLLRHGINLDRMRIPPE